MLFRSPKLMNRPIWSFKLGNWSFWLITFGISIMGIVLSAAGLQQGYMLMAGVEWLDTVVSIRPYWLVRTLAGISMDIGMTLLVYNLMRTAMAAGPVPVVVRGSPPGMGQDIGAGVTP